MPEARNTARPARPHKAGAVGNRVKVQRLEGLNGCWPGMKGRPARMGGSNPQLETGLAKQGHREPCTVRTIGSGRETQQIFPISPATSYRLRRGMTGKIQPRCSEWFRAGSVTLVGGPNGPVMWGQLRKLPQARAGGGSSFSSASPHKVSARHYALFNELLTTGLY